jgi:hypothetical protein
VTLWAWVAEFPVKPVATAATAATEQGDKGELSQVSQLSQGVAGERVRHEGGQVSQLSQPFGEARAHGSDDDREAFEERAAIMEFDGGMTRAEAERAAAANKIEANIVPAELVRWPFEEWGDLRPCLLCRNLSPGGRCLAAWRGELRAARDYSPTFPELPQRCIGYRPKADDPERTTGRERWPELARWQARVSD